MTEPIQYPSLTPRHALPLLLAGQAQKEFFVNAAFASCDALLHPAIEGETNTPPPEPQDGEGWLVGGDPTGEFAGQSGMLAFRQQSAWVFAQPRDGMRVMDRASGPHVVVDSDARAAIGALITALASAGILPEN